jgi:hypothetical protein
MVVWQDVGHDAWGLLWETRTDYTRDRAALTNCYTKM